MSQDLLNIGETAPDFSLPNHNGEMITLSSFEKQKIVLWFFPKASTPGWTVEGEGFRDESEKFKKSGYTIIGVSADPPKKQKKFVDKYNFPFTMLCDESHLMLEAYKVWGLKKFMGREFVGQIRSTFLIKDKKIINVWRNVKVKNHAKEVLNYLKYDWYVFFTYTNSLH